MTVSGPLLTRVVMSCTNIINFAERIANLDISKVPHLPAQRAQESFRMLLSSGMAHKQAETVLVAMSGIWGGILSGPDAARFLSGAGFPEQTAANLVDIMRHEVGAPA